MKRVYSINLLFSALFVIHTCGAEINSDGVMPFSLTPLAATTQGLSGGGPRLAIDKSEIDFGVLDQECLTSRVVALRNDGESTLVIKAIQRGGCCSPFEYSLSAGEVRPGDTANLVISFDSGSVVGRVQTKLRVVSSDVENTNTIILVRAEVRPGLVLIPDRMIIRGLGQRVAHRNVIMKHVRANGLELLQVEASSAAITVSSHPRGDDIILDVSVDGGKLQQESGSHQIMVHFSGAKPVRCTIPIEVVRE